MKLALIVLLGIAVLLQALGIFVKLLGFIGLIKSKEDEVGGFERYATYSLIASIFFEVIFILALVFISNL